MKSIYEFLLGEHLLKSKTDVSTQDTDYVDLGLPSGLLWAKCNIGANDPYEYGDYFMWGSTKPNTNDKCNWTNYPFNNGSNDYDRNYFNSIKDEICKNGILTPEYDAATVILGDGWRLPTEYEFQELIDNTEQEWIKNYKGSNINGVLLTPKNAEAADAELGAELFIPAAGYRSGSIFYDQGSYGYLWSSVLNMISPYCTKTFYLNRSYCSMTYGNHYYGFCLRGVKEI